MRFEDLIGLKTIIIGDVGRGKTQLTFNIILKLVELEFSRDLVILDFAPNRIEVRGEFIGGKLIEFNELPRSVKYYTDEIYAPRLMGKNCFEVVRLASLNRLTCERLLKMYLNNPSPILIINDVSIYLQIGDLGLLPRVINECETFIANGYFGERLADDMGSGISSNERKNMVDLVGMMDLVINLNLVDFHSIFNSI